MLKRSLLSLVRPGFCMFLQLHSFVPGNFSFFGYTKKVRENFDVGPDPGVVFYPLLSLLFSASPCSAPN